MTDDDQDRLANEWVAAGALFGVLSGSEVTVERIVEDEAEAAMVCRFPFLNSAYRVTVTMIEDSELTPAGGVSDGPDDA